MTAVVDKRVLVVDGLSGTNDFAVGLCHELATRCSLSVLSVENSRIDDASVPVKLFKAWPLFGGGIDFLTIRKAANGFLLLLRETLRHRRATVHSQYPRFYLFELMFFILARLFVRQLVFTAHNAVPHERSKWREALLHVWYRVPHRIVVLSRNVQQEIIARFGIRPEKIDVIPHGSYVALRESCKVIAPSVAVAELLQRLQGHILIFQFGIIREYKGVDTLIAAASKLPASLPWHVLVLGGGPPALIESYQQRVHEAGLSERVTIRREFLPNPDLAALAERADILTFPYRDISQSGALMLGLSFGKPCVCTDIPGFREYAGADEVLFFQKDDAASLAAALEALLLDAPLRERLGQAAWRAATGRYAWSSVVSLYLKSYGIQEDGT